MDIIGVVYGTTIPVNPKLLDMKRSNLESGGLPATSHNNTTVVIPHYLK
jgi:hypothetical protein